MVTIDVVSGFLGAGKTTLCNKLLHYFIDHGERPVYIVNEFGKTGLDAELMRTEGFSSISIEGGCICCTLKESIAATIRSVMEEYSPTRILFEPSGVFIFDNFLELFQGAEFSQSCRVGALITVVDCLNFEKLKTTYGSFYYNQIKNATAIVLSKTNASNQPIDEIICDIRNINPDAEVISKKWEEFQERDFTHILDSNFTHEKMNYTRWHGALQTTTINVRSQTKLVSIETLIILLMNGTFGDIYRVKGIVSINKRSVLINVAGPERIFQDYKGVADNRITIIGKKIDMFKLQLYLQSL